MAFLPPDVEEALRQKAAGGATPQAPTIPAIHEDLSGVQAQQPAAPPDPPPVKIVAAQPAANNQPMISSEGGPIAGGVSIGDDPYANYLAAETKREMQKGPGRVVPAGFRAESRTSVENKYDPEELKKIEGANQSMIGAAAGEGQIAANRADIDYGTKANEAQDAINQYGERKEKISARQAKIDAATAQIEADLKEVNRDRGFFGNAWHQALNKAGFGSREEDRIRGNQELIKSLREQGMSEEQASKSIAADQAVARTKVAQALAAQYGNTEEGLRMQKNVAVLERDAATKMADLTKTVQQTSEKYRVRSVVGGPNKDKIRKNLKELSTLGASIREENRKERASQGDVYKELETAGKSLTSAGIPEMQSNMDAFSDMIKRNEEKGRVPGVTKDAKTTARDALGKVLPTSMFGAEDRQNKQDFMRGMLAYRHAVTGAGGSDKEAQMIEDAFVGARTLPELKKAEAFAQSTVANLQENAKMGLSPRARQILEQREAQKALAKQRAEELASKFKTGK